MIRPVIVWTSWKKAIPGWQSMSKITSWDEEIGLGPVFPDIELGEVEVGVDG